MTDLVVFLFVGAMVVLVLFAIGCATIDFTEDEPAPHARPLPKPTYSAHLEHGRKLLPVSLFREGYVPVTMACVYEGRNKIQEVEYVKVDDDDYEQKIQAAILKAQERATTLESLL